MPIPIIIWGAIAVTTALVGILKGVSAASRIKSAKAKYSQDRTAYDTFINIYENKYKYVSEQFEELGRIRLNAMITLGEAVKFLEKAKLKERDILERFNLSPQKLIEWKKASINAIDVLGGLVSSATSGVATAASAYGLVGMLASASTGTAISTLSGAAATNATLAWLGGGTLASGGGGIAAGTMVFGGLVAGPAIMVMGFVAGWQAAKVERQVEESVSELKIDQTNKEKLMSALDVVVKRVHELRGSTTKTAAELKNILAEANLSDLTDAYLVAKTAKTLGDLLEVAILDMDGNIIQEQENE